jgi:hypothetical protein
MANQLECLLVEADIDRWLAGGGLFPTAVTPPPALRPRPPPTPQERRHMQAPLHPPAAPLEADEEAAAAK